MNFIILMYVTAIVAMPGLVDLSVLTLQVTHRNLAAWEGSTTQLVTRQHYQANTLHWEVDDRVSEVVELASFSYIYRLLGGGLELNRALITALVKGGGRRLIPSTSWVARQRSCCKM